MKATLRQRIMQMLRQKKPIKIIAYRLGITETDVHSARAMGNKGPDDPSEEKIYRVAEQLRMQRKESYPVGYPADGVELRPQRIVVSKRGDVLGG